MQKLPSPKPGWRRLAPDVAAAATLLLLVACASPGMRGAVNPAAHLDSPIRTMLVVGMDERPLIRAGWENDVVAALQKRQVNAVASYNQFPLTTFSGTQDQIRQALAAANVQFALFAKTGDRTDFVAGAPMSFSERDISSAQASQYLYLTAGGGDIETDLRLGAKLYRVSDGALVWSGVVDKVVKEGYDSIALLRSIARSLVGEMSSAKVIP
jgi:TolB-like protein